MESNETTGTKETPPMLIDCAEAARLAAVCPRTVHNASKAGTLKTVRIGRCVRYEIADVRAWIDSCKK